MQHCIGKKPTAVTDTELTNEEYQNALDILILSEQRKMQEIERNYNKLTKSLKVFTDEKGKIRL